jgi:polyhydroxybutyrate depolymerase
MAIATAGTYSVAQDGNRLEKAFNRVDTDDDGKLSQGEIGRFAPLKSRLAGADKDRDGFVSFAEFRQQIAGGIQRLEPSTGKLSAGESLRVVKVGELERRYRVHVPKTYDAGKATPVVIACHGGGGNPESMIRLSGLNEKSEEAGFIVVYPYGSGRDEDRNLTFNGGNVGGYAKHRNIDDVGFTRELLKDLATAVNVDPDRGWRPHLARHGPASRLPRQVDEGHLRQRPDVGVL